MAPATPTAIPANAVALVANGKDWLYNKHTGAIVHETGITKYLTLHNPANLVMDPPWLQFASKAEAEAYKKAHPPTPQTGPAGGIANATTGAENLGAGALPSLTDVNGFVSALTQRATWLRLGEGVLGLILIAVGVIALTKSSSIGQAAQKTAGTAAKFIK